MADEAVNANVNVNNSRRARRTNDVTGKRTTVPAACHICRSRKVKCDGQRPCGQCLRRGLDCQYSTLQNETQRQADTRQSEAAIHDAQTLRSLFKAIALEENEAKAMDLFTQIRRGHSPNSILRHIRSASTDSNVSNVGDVQLTILLTLAQSTASLEEVASMAASAFLADASPTLPTQAQFEHLRGRKVTLREVEELMRNANDEGVSSHMMEMDVTAAPLRPSHQAPVKPWTTMLDTDEEMSQFLSVYFSLINPIYRFVEEDLVMAALNAGDISSPGCSPLLVHALIALTSMFCDFEKAFDKPERYYDRGEHFSQEAFRLWALENERASIVNIQSVLMMSYGVALRGHGGLGETLSVKADELIARFKIESSPPSDDDERRARAGVYQSAAYYDLLVRSAYRIPCHLSEPTVHLTRTSFTLRHHERVIRGSSYPPNTFVQPYSLQALAAAREDVMYFMFEINQLINSRERDRSTVAHRTADTIHRCRVWYANLNASMRYQETMSMGLFEFHALCHTFRLLLHDLYDECDSATQSTNTNHELTLEGNALAEQAGALLKDFREAFGFKFVPSTFMMLSNFSSCRLLKQLQRISLEDSGLSKQPSRTAQASSAVEECFRCLLAMSLQQALPMKIAQAIYIAALDMQVYLPPNVLRVLTILLQPKLQDLRDHKVDSLCPRPSIELRPDMTDAASTLLSMASDSSKMHTQHT